MIKITKGMLARSKAGHDAGNWYVVVDADEKYAYLADGERRTLAKLKKKKLMHIQICYKTPEWLYEALKSGAEVQDEHIRKAIKEFKNDHQED